MSSNVGLSTPRGSGTSGYVQRNLSALRPRDAAAPYSKDYDAIKAHRQRMPDKEILEHDRKREVEVKVFELRDRLEDEGIDEDEIETRTTALRTKLLANLNNPTTTTSSGASSASASRAKTLKAHQVHELAAAKIEESEKLRRALGIREDYQEGGHWRRQEERLREGVAREREREREGGGERERDEVRRDKERESADERWRRERDEQREGSEASERSG